MDAFYGLMSQPNLFLFKPFIKVGEIYMYLHSTCPFGIVLASLAASSGLAGETIINVASDYMSSGFFQGDYLRGDEAGSSRSSNRATATTVFGVTGETAYFSFDFDPTLFAGPASSAVFRVESVSTGFFTDPSTGNPALVSLHSLTEDPMAAVDQSTADGPGSWVSFRDEQITTESIISTTTVDGLGVYEWDVTALINAWIAGGSDYAHTIGTSTLLDPDSDAAVAFVNSTWSGLTDELTARLVIVPAPGVGLAALMFGGVIGSKRRRR